MRDPDDPEGELGRRRVLAHVKCNLAPMAQSQQWEVVEVHVGGIATAAMRYIGESDHQSQDLLDRVTTGEERTAVDEAVEILEAELADGPKPTAEVWRTADTNGVSRATFKRARLKLGVRSRKDDAPNGPWMLSLPEGVQIEGAHPYMAPMSHFNQTQSQSGIEGVQGIEGVHAPDIEPL